MTPRLLFVVVVLVAAFIDCYFICGERALSVCVYAAAVLLSLVAEEEKEAAEAGICCDCGGSPPPPSPSIQLLLLLSRISVWKRGRWWVLLLASLTTCRRTRWTREEQKEWEGGSAGWWEVYSWLEERGEMETAKIKLMKAKDKQQSEVQINT